MAVLIKDTIWRDRDFRALPRLAQATYLEVVSQKELDCAGLLTLNLPLLAKGCDEITEDDLREDLALLEQRRFVFVDYDTFELFVRSKMRAGEVVRSPNILKSALKSARAVESPKIRAEVAAELRRLNRADATRIADEIDPSPTPPPANRNPSETLPEGVNPSEGVTEGSNSYSVSISNSLSVVGHLGEGSPPPRSCPKHPSGTDEPCWACKQRRIDFEAWETEHGQAAGDADETARRRLAELRDNCQTCKGTNWIPDTEPAERCTHREAASEAI